MSDKKEWLKIEDAADILGISKSTVHNRIVRGMIPGAEKRFYTWYIPADALDSPAFKLKSRGRRGGHLKDELLKPLKGLFITRFHSGYYDDMTIAEASEAFLYSIYEAISEDKPEQIKE